MKIKKRFFLIEGIILYICPFIVRLLNKSFDLKFALFFFILGAISFIKYAYELNKEDKKDDE